MSTRQTHHPDGKRYRHRLRGCLVLVGKLCLGLWLLTLLATLSLRWLPPPTSSFMMQWCLAAWWRGQGCHLQYHWVAWSQIAPAMKLAVVAAEDQKFPYHFGFDVQAIVEAWEDHQEGGRLRGASTISQQVAKNLFLWSGRHPIRKAVEAYFTVLIELFWSKRRILEVYLNLVELGRGQFGVEAASRTFFHKPAARLQPPEAALLAAVLPNPRHFLVQRPSSTVLKRQAWILRQMQQLGGPGYLRDL